MSSIVGAQRDFLTDILDSIQESSHLVLLHHKLIWMYNHKSLKSIIVETSNAKLDSCFYCINPNNFNSEIYPRLVDIHQKGIEIICIGGDIGFKAKDFEFKTADGIYFLASGIHAGKVGNKALLFSHDLIANKLSWKFVKMTNL